MIDLESKIRELGQQLYSEYMVLNATPTIEGSEAHRRKGTVELAMRWNSLALSGIRSR